LASVDDEKRQLQVTVAMLRDELDRTHINSRQETEKMELRHLQECRELRETIEVMRKKLEAVRKASA